MGEKSKFDKVLGVKDILVIVLGAMIGWAWVVNTGDWVTIAGSLGTLIAFAIGGTMIIFVSFTYAELTAAMPQCGGEHVFSYRAMGPVGSFICTWAIILGYVAVAAFEAAALPSVITYLFPNFNQVYLYTIAGYDIYLTSILFGSAMAFVIMMINIAGVKMAAGFQTILTTIIAVVAIVLVIVCVHSGDPSNFTGQLFQTGNGTVVNSIFKVTCMTPFLFMGFDIIPQAAEEIKVPYKRIGRIMVMSITIGVAWYMMIVFAVCYMMSGDEISAEMATQTSLVTAKAMQLATNTDIMAYVVVFGGVCGIVTTWNSFLLGGSRALYSMGESLMLPERFGKLGKHKTPVAATVLCGIACMVAPFFGRGVLIWLSDTASFGCVVAYFMVSISFVILRKKEPDMVRPYKVKHGMVKGVIAICFAGFMISLYVLPFEWTAHLVWQEWIVVGAWVALGVFFFFYSKKRYGKDFAKNIIVEMDKELL